MTDQGLDREAVALPEWLPDLLHELDAAEADFADDMVDKAEADGPLAAMACEEAGPEYTLPIWQIRAILALLPVRPPLEGEADLAQLDRWFADIPPGPYDALHHTNGWEVRQLDTAPGDKHHWPFRLCESIAGQRAGCDEAIFSFIAGVINAWPLIAQQAEEIARLKKWSQGELSRLRDVHDALRQELAAAEAGLAAAKGRERALEDALTPSAETKAAFSGEFNFPVNLRLGREEVTRYVAIPWVTTKQIMAAIRAYAARHALSVSTDIASRGGDSSSRDHAHSDDGGDNSSLRSDAISSTQGELQ